MCRVVVCSFGWLLFLYVRVRQAEQFSRPRVMVHRERSVGEARQETPLGQASSAGVEGRRASQAK